MARLGRKTVLVIQEKVRTARAHTQLPTRFDIMCDVFLIGRKGCEKLGDKAFEHNFLPFHTAVMMAEDHSAV